VPWEGDSSIEKRRKKEGKNLITKWEKGVHRKNLFFPARK